MSTRFKDRPMAMCEYCSEHYVVREDRFNPGRSGIIWRISPHNAQDKRCLGSRMQIDKRHILFPAEAS
jgi:hypothetical protein